MHSIEFHDLSTDLGPEELSYHVDTYSTLDALEYNRTLNLGVAEIPELSTESMPSDIEEDDSYGSVYFDYKPDNSV